MGPTQGVILNINWETCPELAPFKAKVLDMVEPIVAAQGKPAVASESVAASELVTIATAATNPDPSISDLAQHSNSASPRVTQVLFLNINWGTCLRLWSHTQ